jgi:hypothetical protein
MGGLGFRDTELFNLALLAQLAWRILQPTNTLSSSILKVVYYPSKDFLEADLGSHPCQTRRSLVEGRDPLSLGLIRRIGDQKNRKVWSANWLPHVSGYQDAKRSFTR